MKRDLFMFDIETVGNYKDWNDFKLSDLKGAELFKKKYDKFNWEDKYESIDQAYIENSGIVPAFGKIVCISFGFLDNNGDKKIKSYFGHNEREIVENFNDLLKKIEKKNFNLSGFRILHFDIPWILHKLHKYQIEPAEIIYCYDKKPWEMRVTDMSEDWRQKFAWSFSFDEMCYELDVESPKDNMDGSQVHKKYWNDDIESIKEYCEKDVSSSIDCSLKMYK